MITRHYDHLENYLQPNKVLVLYGPRRVGKTTLLQNFLSRTSLKYRLETGDDLSTRQTLSSESIPTLRQYASGFDLIAIDEAQKIPQVGQGLKILVDHVPNLKIVVTGSASLDLSNKLGEPLTGRQFIYTLYPVSQLELSSQTNPHDLKTSLESYLRWGSYTEVLSLDPPDQKDLYLKTLVHNYLFKDILELERIKGVKLLTDLLKLIAFQVGSEVSLTELGSTLGLDKKTVYRYLYLLEKSFIIFELRGLSRNLRSEITKKSKFYFLDNGVRNAIISNFNPLDTRNDTGQLWENFLVSERKKTQEYARISANNYFWRTWSGQEIDWVEEYGGQFHGYEFKFAPPKKSTIPSLWTPTYPDSTYHIIHSKNYHEFLTPISHLAHSNNL